MQQVGLKTFAPMTHRSFELVTIIERIATGPPGKAKPASVRVALVLVARMRREKAYFI